MLLLVVPVITVLVFSPPLCLLFFLVGALVPFFTGKSRTVIDPVADIPERARLSPSDFHLWADLVTSTGDYQRKYDRFVYDSSRGFDEKLPLVFSQIKAINYIHAHKVLFALLLGLNAFCVYDVFFSNQTFTSPIVTGLCLGIVWGYSLGVFTLWRTCRKFKGTSDLPL